MNLGAVIRKAVSTAMRVVDKERITVSWTFRSASAEDYDPLLDEMTQVHASTHDLRVLIYDEADSDNTGNYSSTGLYVDSPKALEKAVVLIPWSELVGRPPPSSRDSLVWDGVPFSVDQTQRVVSDAVYICKIVRG